MMKRYLFFCFFTSLFGANFVLFTQPKTATHLLIPILTSLTGKQANWVPRYQENQSLLPRGADIDFQQNNVIYFSLVRAPWDLGTFEMIWQRNEQQGTFLHLHAPFSPQLEKFLLDNHCVNFFVLRDPRDQAVSLLNHYKYIQPDRAPPSLSDREILRQILKTQSRRDLLAFLGWTQSPACCVLDFQALMGSRGGRATKRDALGELSKIRDALQLNISDEALQSIYEEHFGKGWSFFQGKVGVWEAYFDPELKAIAKQELGDLLITLGFEKDLNW